MTVTRDVVKDLLPLSMAGEASADTRAVVEAFLRSDPEIAQYAEALREDTVIAPAPAAAPGAPAPGRAALARTRSLLRRRTWLMAAAIFCSGLPFSFAAGNDGVTFLMLRHAPWVSAALLAAAGVLWGLYAATARRLRVSGL
jgi:hypothetical protein